MDAPVVILLLSFALFVAMNVPIAVAMGLSAWLTILSVGSIPPTVIIAQRMAAGVDSFALLAIPFFILAGLLMGRGGIARRMLDFAAALVGWLPGGLAYVNVLACMMFGAVSGSAAAAVSSIGGCLIPEMNKKGYSREFNVALTSTAATTGLLIPPSNVMIVFAVVAGNVSIATLFVAGVMPGIVVGLCLMVAAGIIAVRRGYGGGARLPFVDVLKAFWHACPSLLLIVVVMGGILSGWFTATEAAAISVVYSFVLAVLVYREVKWRELSGILLDAGVTTAIVMLMVATSSAMSWILAHQSIPQDVSASLLSLSDNKIVLLLIINVVLLVVGMFMDMTPAVLIFTPIFLPVAVKLGMNPVHFGIILIANLCIGLCTPPVGTCLFLGCSIGKTTIARTIGPAIPFFLAMLVALACITYLPQLTLFLPHMLGMK